MDTVTPASAQKLLDQAGELHAQLVAAPSRATALALLELCEQLEEQILILHGATVRTKP